MWLFHNFPAHFGWSLIFFFTFLSCVIFLCRKQQHDRVPAWNGTALLPLKALHQKWWRGYYWAAHKCFSLKLKSLGLDADRKFMLETQQNEIFIVKQKLWREMKSFLRSISADRKAWNKQVKQQEVGALCLNHFIMFPNLDASSKHSAFTRMLHLHFRSKDVPGDVL